jgi:reactive intermediate/imine deaminase
MEREPIAPLPFPEADAPYVQGVKVRGADTFIFVSAQVAYDERKRVVGPGDPAVQTHQALRNLARVLREAGATLSDVVKVTVFITDLAHFSAVARVRSEYFGENLPASSFSVVKSLSRAELLVAIDAIAVKGGETA